MSCIVDTIIITGGEGGREVMGPFVGCLFRPVINCTQLAGPELYVQALMSAYLFGEQKQHPADTYEVSVSLYSGTTVVRCIH